MNNGLLDSQSDSALIGRFLTGDEPAFRALYRRHSPRLRAMIARLLGARRADADDVLQETWLAACRALHQYRGESKFSTWLTTIAIRAARARLFLPQQTTLPFDDDFSDRERALPLEVIDLERALARLPDHQRIVLVLHDVEGFTHEEIALQLGVACGTSKGTLSRARQALRRLLTEGVGHER